MDKSSKRLKKGGDNSSEKKAADSKSKKRTTKKSPNPEKQPPNCEKTTQESDVNPEKKGTPTLLSLCSSLQLSDVAKLVIEVGFEKSTKEQIEVTLDELISPIMDQMADGKIDDAPLMSAMLSFLKTLSSWAPYGKRFVVKNLFATFSEAISSQTVEIAFRNAMVLLITKFVQTTHFNEHSKYGLSLLQHLLSTALDSDSKNVTAADLKRIKELKKFILGFDVLNPSANTVLQYFMRAFVSKTFLRTREGILILSFFLSKEESLVKLIQTRIRDNLMNLSRKEAANYGDIYFHAWILSESTPVRKEIEQRCIQDIMYRTVSLERCGLAFGPVGTLTFGILQVLRSNRRSLKFSQVMTDLYQPILWRNLKSPNAVVRCNSAQIFFDAFPLEKVGQGTTANCNFKDMQVKEIGDLLVDECHLVRIIAIKGVGHLLAQCDFVISVAQMKALLEIITTKLAVDCSSYLVRLAVFNMFENLVSIESSAALALLCMKKLSLSLHDENEKVRKAFVKVLLRLSEVNEPQNVAFDVCSAQLLLYRLKVEGPLVGECLVKLIFPKIYKRGQDVDTTMRNLSKIIAIGPDALINLFKYSKKILTVDEVYYVLITIIGVTNKHIKEKMAQLSQENVENSRASSSEPSTSSSVHKPKKKAKKALSNITNTSENGSSGEESSSESSEDVPERSRDFLDNHKLISGFLNGASILWATFGDDLEKEERLDTIRQIAIPAIPLLLRYYKGTRVYYTVVSFASLIPIQLLAPHSTITGACLAELREMDESSDLEVMKCLMMALCFWNRGQDIVEVAIDWLDQAFRHENLNNTLTLPKSKKRQPKVRFQPMQGKPFLAIKLLEMLFGHSACEQRLLIKDYDRLYEILVYLERIKELIERRIENGSEFKEHDLSDRFLEGCLSVYLQMIIVMNRPDRPPSQVSDISEPTEAVSASSMTSEMLEWANRVLIGELRKKNSSEDPLVVKCINHVMKTAILAINLSYTDKEHCLLTAVVASKLSSLEDAVPFLEIYFNVLKAMCEYSKVYNPRDEWGIFSTVVPAFLQQCMDVVTSDDITIDVLAKYTEDTKAFKSNLFACLITYQQIYNVEHPLFLEVSNVYLSTCIELIRNEIAETDEVDVLRSFDNHPLCVALIMRFFLSKKPLTSIILPWIQSHLTRHKSDPAIIISGVSLITTLALSYKSRFEVNHIELCTSKIHQLLMALDDQYKNVKDKGDEMIRVLCQESGCALISSS